VCALAIHHQSDGLDETILTTCNFVDTTTRGAAIVDALTAATRAEDHVYRMADE
jgi:hypothetical protein